MKIPKRGDVIEKRKNKEKLTWLETAVYVGFTEEEIKEMCCD